MAENERTWVGPLTGKRRSLGSSKSSDSASGDPGASADVNGVLVEQLQARVADLQKTVDALQRALEFEERAHQEILERWAAEQEFLRRGLPGPSTPVTPVEPTEAPIDTIAVAPRRVSWKWASLALVPVLAAGIWFAWPAATRRAPARKPAAVPRAKAPESANHRPAPAPKPVAPAPKPAAAVPPAQPASQPARASTAPAPAKKPANPIVLIVPGSAHYHADKCWILGRKHKTPMPLSAAQAKGYTECRYCRDRVIAAALRKQD